MNKPRVIWQHKGLGYRIVRSGPKDFALESLYFNAMGDESWTSATWLDKNEQTQCMDKLPEWALLSILEKLSRRRRRSRKAVRS